MRDDQYLKLQQLEEKLLDVFISEADPSSWPGQGIALGAMDSKTRGDLYWVRKTAASVLVLSNRIANVIGQSQLRAGAVPPPQGSGGSTEQDEGEDGGAQMDQEVAKAEREALRLMRELQAGGPGKLAFDKRVHGK